MGLFLLLHLKADPLMHSCDRWGLKQPGDEPPELTVAGSALVLLLSGFSSCRVLGCSGTSCATAHHAALEAQARCANSAAVPGASAAQLAFLGNHQ